MLRDCLHSVQEKTKGLTYEIIVVDDGSTDEALRWCARNSPK